MKSQIYDLVFAEELILERCYPLETESVPVVNAAGRVLACDVMGEPRTAERGAELCAKAQKVLVQKGNIIKPIVHGALVSLGISQVEVYRKPLVGFYFLDSLEKEQYSDEERAKLNRYIVGNALKEAEISSIYQGTVPEAGDQLAQDVRVSSTVYDAIIICGGSAEGDFERMQEVVEQTGAEMVVYQVGIELGSKVCTAFIDNVPVFGMTGDPAEILTALYLVLMPALKKIAGRSDEAHEKIMVELVQDFPESNEETAILPGKMEFSDGVVRMHSLDRMMNGSIWSMQDVDVFAIVPAGSGPLKKGTLLDAYRIIR